MKHRCFIAIYPSIEAKGALTAFIQSAKNYNQSRSIVYVKTDILHSTLHFLGYRNEEEIDIIDSIVYEAVKKFCSFVLSIENLSGFPNLTNPKVLFLECIDITGTVNQLQNEIGRKLFEAGFEIDTRKWVCHFTLARIKKNIELDLSHLLPSSVSFKVEKIFLMKSVLGKNGPTHSVIKNYTLYS